MKSYILSKPAETDLEEVGAYLTTEAELREAMRFLGVRTEAGHFRIDLTDEPVRFWCVYSYLIVYDPAKKPIEIVRVVHGARDISTLL